MSSTLDAIMDSVDEHWGYYDKDESGELGQKEFRDFVRDVLTAHDLEPDERGFRRVFRDYDEDGSGTINREECDEMLKHMWVSACIEGSWANLEKDDDEPMSKGEFRRFARECLEAMGYGDDWGKGDLDELIDEYDADGDGEMSKDEVFDFLDDYIGSNTEEEED
eukprot:Nitzschia sp. Nitz4//scaffold46_size129759//87122//87699//NITZ4_003513-RA/size129759-augustus-gene-0.12-mRNA-1//1//CDS//3329552631//6058//frame0